MKSSSKFFAALTLALLVGVSFGARAEEQEGYPVQFEIEARQIHATHSLRNDDVACEHEHKHVATLPQIVAPAVLFPPASDKLTPAATAAIKKVAALLKGHPYKGRHILISGYSDNKGNDATNQRLSYHRAVAVVKQLVKDGAPAARLTAQGFGKENPVATNDTPAGRALNRRVTFTVGEAPAK
jgi:outer membrane protein OmpA-like peptidoglycan-associated protein